MHLTWPEPALSKVLHVGSTSLELFVALVASSHIGAFLNSDCLLYQFGAEPLLAVRPHVRSTVTAAIATGALGSKQLRRTASGQRGTNSAGGINRGSHSVGLVWLSPPRTEALVALLGGAGGPRREEREGSKKTLAHVCEGPRKNVETSETPGRPLF